MMLIASGVTARAASDGFRPRPTRILLALGESCSPAPTSSSRGAFSRMMTRKPFAASASDAVSPPIPAPATTTVRAVATDGSGDFIPQHAFGRARSTGREIGREAIQRRAVGADDLVVVTEIEEHMRMVERRVRAH